MRLENKDDDLTHLYFMVMYSVTPTLKKIKERHALQECKQNLAAVITRIGIDAVVGRVG